MSLNLTPINVRGKRKAPIPPTSNIPTALQLQQEVQEEEERKQAPHPPDGDSRPHTQSKSQSKTQSKRPILEVMAAHAMQDKPALDSLPSEILEKILLYSSNLSLPHASPVIGAKLSEKATLIRFFIWAFHETWDQWFGIPTSKALNHGPPVFRKQSKRVEGDYALQTAVLNQPWATIDVILTSQQTWADNHAAGRWYQHSIPWSDEEEDVEHSHRGGPTHFNARECFQVDYEQALRWSPFRVESLPWGFQDVHPQARIPISLITGPWDTEKLQRLFWLTRGGMMPAQSLNNGPTWEDKVEYLRNAVLNVTQPNILAINCLMSAWIFQGLPAEVVRDELNNVDRRLTWGDDTDEVRQILQRTRGAMNMFLDYRAARRSSV